LAHEKAAAPNILILEPEDRHVDKVKIDIEKNSVLFFNNKKSKEFDLSKYNKVRLKAKWDFRWGLHMIINYTNAGGYTDHYVTLEGDPPVYPLLIGDPDVSYTPAYKAAVKIAAHTGFIFLNDVSGEVITDAVVEEEPNEYPDDVANDVVPMAPSYLTTEVNDNSGAAVYDLPQTRLTSIGMLVYFVFFAIDIIFPFFLMNSILTVIPEVDRLHLVLILISYTPAILIPAYYLASRLYTRVRVKINDEQVAVERRFLRAKVRKASINDIKRVYLHYDSYIDGRYGESLLYRKKKTPNVIIKTAKEKIKFGAGLDYAELKFFKHAIEEIKRKAAV
jgi:hypothetical protein